MKDRGEDLRFIRCRRRRRHIPITSVRGGRFRVGGRLLRRLSIGGRSRRECSVGRREETFIPIVYREGFISVICRGGGRGSRGRGSARPMIHDSNNERFFFGQRHPKLQELNL